MSKFIIKEILHEVNGETVKIKPINIMETVTSVINEELIEGGVGTDSGLSDLIKGKKNLKGDY